MKKLGAVALTILLAGSPVVAHSVSAKEANVQVCKEQAEHASDYMKASGVITAVEASKSSLRVTIENEEGIEEVLIINEKSYLLSNKTTATIASDRLKKGMHVEAYTDKNKPMILIYPAQYTPELVVVKDENGQNVKVNKFDDEFLSLDKELKLTIAEDTVLQNQQGKPIGKADLKGKELMVFYTATTRSIPPQTTPTKVIALDPLEQSEEATVNKIIEADHYMKDGVKMIPLRKVAEALGYTVVSQGHINGALVKKENRSFTITRGEKKYGLNKSLRQFAIAPELIGGNKTYVSEDFLDAMLSDQ